MDVLVGSVAWLEEDICIFVRLKDTLDLRIERHAPARFFAVILGPVVKNPPLATKNLLEDTDGLCRPP